MKYLFQLPLLVVCILGYAQHAKMKEIDSYFMDLENMGAFSGSVTIVRNDTLVIDKGYGLSDRNKRKTISTNTLFDIASVSKQFTSTAILLMESQGKLNTNDKIAKHLANIPTDKKEITIEQLAGHTSGLPPDHVLINHLYDTKSKSEAVSEILSLPLNFTPGTSYSYSNAGYILLAAIVEKLARDDFKNYIKNELLAKAEMRHTGFIGDKAWNSNTDVAHGYWNQYDQFYRGELGIAKSDWNILGGGGMYSTSSDLVKWFNLLWTGKIIPAESVKKMFSLNNNKYAYGWQFITRPDNTLAVIFHNGSADSYETALRYYPQRKLIAAITSSSKLDDASAMHDEYLNGAVGLLLGREVLMPPKTRSAFSGNVPIGTYHAQGRGDRWQIWKDFSNNLWIAPRNSFAFRYLSKIMGSDSNHLSKSAKYVEEFITMGQTVKCGNSRRAFVNQILPSDWNEVWCSWIIQYGSFKGLDIHGSLPLLYASDRNFVYATLRFQRRSLLISFLVENNRMIEAWSSPDVTAPASYRLTATDLNTNSLINPFNMKSVLTLRTGSSPLELIFGAGESDTILIKD